METARKWFKQDITMHANESPFSITLEHQEDTATTIDWEAIDFSRLVYIVMM